MKKQTGNLGETTSVPRKKLQQWELSLDLGLDKMSSTTKGKANQKPTHCSQLYGGRESQEGCQDFRHKKKKSKLSWAGHAMPVIQNLGD